MQLLLDTHAFLWAISDDPRLGKQNRQRILQEATGVWLSHVSLWEITLKHTLARADMPLSAAQATQWAEEAGFALLPIAVPHLLTLEQLPLHHRDPYRCAEDSVFDRLLVAQAVREELTLLSSDEAFQAYGCLLRDARD
ncbi:MAG: type II toxin-antitoxin system VapC family toxin [Cyanobacteriota bacterium]|nr:type II toxin-antitoxin system VapC family toxin [Cyanobacteriota bacterium]